MRPSDFYIGISELFSILIPGFLVAISTLYFFGDLEADKSLPTLFWLILIVVSYVLGHVLFAVGSWWDEINNLFQYHGNDALIEKVKHIREQYGDKDCTGINNYQWTKSVLSRLHVVGHMEVLRKEADSKLFRSLIIPLVISIFYFWSELNLFMKFVSFLITVMAFWRYRDQRNKGCTIAYTHIITLFLFDNI